MTFEIWMVDSCSAMPPLMLRWGLGLTCFLTIMTPSTRRRSLSAMTRRTRPCLPLSLPAMTSTLSLRLILMLAMMLSLFLGYTEPESGKKVNEFFYFSLDNFRRERYDLEELFLAQLAGHGAKDAGADRLVG